jgi:hypothetical protein
MVGKLIALAIVLVILYILYRQYRRCADGTGGALSKVCNMFLKVGKGVI